MSDIRRLLDGNYRTIERRSYGNHTVIDFQINYFCNLENVVTWTLLS